MGDVIGLRGDPVDHEPADEPCPVLIATLEAALAQAKAGRIISFIMLVEHPEGDPCGQHGSFNHTDCAWNLDNLLAAMKIEEFKLVRFMADHTETRAIAPDEGA